MYARTVEGAYLAYRVQGDGPIDLVLSSMSVVLTDVMSEEPLISAGATIGVLQPIKRGAPSGVSGAPT